MPFGKVTLIGVGLLGGSLGLAMKQRHLAARVVGYVRRSASLAECTQLGVADHVTLDLHQAVEDADLVVFCTPIAQMPLLAKAMVSSLKPGVIVTDVGSVKGSVVSQLEPLVRSSGGCFIGSHPMAGAERMGPSAARADLFENAVCVLTPTPRSSLQALERLRSFWQNLGSKTLQLSAEEHDELVSRSSHLPHVIAASLANYVLSPLHPREQAVLCANGFRDMTRIASGSPEMWRDIVLANRDNLAQALSIFIEDLEDFRAALLSKDMKTLIDFFEKAKERRDQWRSQTISPE